MKHAALLALLGGLFVLPVAVLALYSLAPGWAFPHPWPQELSLRALSHLAHRGGRISLSIGSSGLYSLATVLLTLLLCLHPASVLAEKDFRGKSLLEGLLLTPALVPPMTFSMGLHSVFIRLGLADSYAGIVLVLAIFSYPYMLRALTGGFQTMGDRFRVCAQNLGAGPWRIFFRVELPLLVPAIIAGGTVVFLVAFSEYFLVFLIGGGTVPSFTGFLFPLLNSSDRALASLLTLIFLILPIALFMLIDLSLSRQYRAKGIA